MPARANRPESDPLALPAIAEAVAAHNAAEDAHSALFAGLAAHADDPLLHPPAYGSASFSASGDTTIASAGFPNWADMHASLQKTIAADGTSPIVVELTLPGVYRDAETSGAYAIGIREGNGDPIQAVLKSVGGTDDSDNIHVKTPPFVPTAGSHTYKACAMHLGGAGADLKLSTPLPYFKAVLEVLGRRTAS